MESSDNMLSWEDGVELVANKSPPVKEADKLGQSIVTSITKRVRHVGQGVINADGYSTLGIHTNGIYTLTEEGRSTLPAHQNRKEVEPYGGVYILGTEVHKE